MAATIEPMFVRFANGQIGARDVVDSYIKNGDDDISRGIAQETLTSLPDISLFRRDFKNALMDLTEGGLNRQLVNYFDSYLKPSLVEDMDLGGSSRVSEKRIVRIKEKGAPWVEALVIYNLGLFIKAFGANVIKCCPVCSKFFTYKGKYGKYCSDPCKESKKK